MYALTAAVDESTLVHVCVFLRVFVCVCVSVCVCLCFRGIAELTYPRSLKCLHLDISVYIYIYMYAPARLGAAMAG